MAANVDGEEIEIDVNKIRDNDALFMELIQEYPTIYDRKSKDFKDRNKKANCWKIIAERLGETVDKVKRRYETIRTNFSRYLSKKKGKSGSGASDVVVDPEYEHLVWLKPFIINRPSSGNFTRESSHSNMTSTQSPQQREFASDEESLYSADTGEESDSSSVVVSKITGKQSSESATNKGISSEERKKRKERKTDSRKRKLEKTDEQLEKSISSLNESIRQQERSSKRHENEMDEDAMYCMSLASRMRKLDDMNKAVVRNSIEKIFLDLQFSNRSSPMQNAMHLIPQQPVQLPNMQSNGMFWPQSSTPFTTSMTNMDT